MSNGEAYNLEVPLGRIPLDRFIALFAEVGIDDRTTTLRIVVDGKEIQRRTLPFAIDLGNRQWKETSIAADEGKNGAPLKFEEMGVWDKTFSNANIAVLMDNIRQYLGPPV